MIFLKLVKSKTASDFHFLQIHWTASTLMLVKCMWPRMSKRKGILLSCPNWMNLVDQTAISQNFFCQFLFLTRVSENWGYLSDMDGYDQRRNTWFMNTRNSHEGLGEAVKGLKNSIHDLLHSMFPTSNILWGLVGQILFQLQLAMVW